MADGKDKVEKAIPSYPRPKPLNAPQAPPPRPPAPSPPPSPKPGGETKELRDELEYRLETSIRYHHRRRRFFDGVSTWVTFVSLVGSSGAVALILAGTGEAAQVALALALALAQGLNIAARPNERAREHHSLAARFIGVQRSLARLRHDANEDALRAVAASLVAVEADEPPQREVLAAIVTNDYAKRVGAPQSQMVRVTKWQRRLAHFIDLHPETLRVHEP